MNKWSSRFPVGIGTALLAAFLFGVSTPMAKLLVADIPPVLLAGLLYAGSGIGLSLWIGIRRLLKQSSNEAPLRRADIPWLSAAVFFGGVLGPVLLMIGLVTTPASTASLMLNLEGVLTAVIAWFVFKENVDRRVFLGMVVIVVGGVLLSWSNDAELGIPWGALAIAGACICWAIDNNFTRVVSSGNPMHIAAIKGSVAGIINIGIALAMGSQWPDTSHIAAAGVIGLCGYGISLVMFVLALRYLGTARTGAYFSTAPFVGAALSLLVFREIPEFSFWIAGGLMAIGVWLHVSEHHEHDHQHEAMAHEHKHMHDEHHQHEHDFPWDGEEPHSHPHEHEPLAHSHTHFPDMHHRHGH